LIRASFNQRRKTLVNGLKNSQELDFSKRRNRESNGRNRDSGKCKGRGTYVEGIRGSGKCVS